MQIKKWADVIVAMIVCVITYQACVWTPAVIVRKDSQPVSQSGPYSCEEVGCWNQSEPEPLWNISSSSWLCLLHSYLTESFNKSWEFLLVCVESDGTWAEIYDLNLYDEEEKRDCSLNFSWSFPLQMAADFQHVYAFCLLICLFCSSYFIICVPQTNSLIKKNLYSCKHICWNQICSQKLDSLQDPICYFNQLRTTKQKWKIKKNNGSNSWWNLGSGVDGSLQSWK